ncbi:MAG TPA: trypsin-like peptidase domain-containing protein [Acidimicrobiales bacterium]|nr:trypsin-like peptidase domain-containing protein [Acidimicrobiales bacterium]
MRWAGLAVAVLVGGVAGGLVVAGTDSSGSGSGACAATSVADRVLPSVVTISARRGTSGGAGSGEIIRSDGYILTNNHVISVAANGGSVEVLFSDGTTAPATITGRDPQTDLAVIKVSGRTSLPVIPFGSSSNLQVGEPVVVLGAPLGLSSTVTSGIVSALDRTIEVPGDNGQNALLVSAIQTDAAINPGNSGGALTDCSGNLIGVPSAGASVPNESGQSSAGSVGLGFAIPVDLARSVSDELIATGTVTHSYFGIEVDQIPAAAAQQAGTSEGLYVVGVVPGGPAARAGVRSGDIITELDGEAVTDPTQLAAITLTKKPGDTVSVTYERNGRSQSTTVALGAQPASAAPAASGGSSGSSSRR